MLPSLGNYGVSMNLSMQIWEMKRIRFKEILSTSIGYSIFICLLLLSCTSTKTIEQNTVLGLNKDTVRLNGNRLQKTIAVRDYGFDDHQHISLKSIAKTSIPSHTIDSLVKLDSIKENKILSEALRIPQFVNPNILDIKSPVADKIVENYLNSTNKEPGGHCLSVSKGRFEQAYKEVHGHLPYQDLPARMASKFYTPKQVFNLLYVSASDTDIEWKSLPEEYRGKGNAGAIAYAGMGTLVDASGIWSGRLRPGALMQVWRYKKDYEEVVKGTDVKKLDPYGHSFIFISYVRDDKNEIIGLRIADQGFQSYRPIVPRDYEVWWAVNLNI